MTVVRTFPVVLLLAGVATAQVPPPAEAPEPLTAARIRAAIDNAVVFLRGLQARDGSIEVGGRNGGCTALAALAMLAAGADPAGDDQLRKALDWLAGIDPDDTYVRGIRANVWEYALRKVPYDTKIRELLKKDYEWLMDAMNDTAWRYNKGSRDWDNSCSQYAVLGIWAAARAGFEPPEAFWQKVSRHFLKVQGDDGGWSYTTGRSTPNMTTAGLASMFLVFDACHGKSFYSAETPRTFTEGDAAEVLASIERGMAWLGKARGRKNDGYYLYGIERTGVASGRRYFGGEDWFRTGAEVVLASQRRNGSIPIGSWGGPAINTAWCTLFLVYGGAPVAFSKLQYGDGPDWNLNPRDLANVAKQLWSAYERPLNWEVVSIDTAARDLDAPILFLSGAKAATFTEEQVLMLREYLLRGGTIFAEPTDRSEAFADSMHELLRLMFASDEYPKPGLTPLPANHGVYTVLKQDWKQRPRLLGMSDGSRTFFFLSQGYLSADWQMNRTDSDAFKLATNLLFYVTDRGELEGKFATALPDTPPAAPRDAVVTVARVKHVSARHRAGDWNAAPLAWQAFAPYATHVTGCRLAERRPVSLGDDDLADIQVLHITGREGLHLTARQRAALKRFVDGGGFVLVDAYAGSQPFAKAAREQLEALFGELKPLAADHVLAAGRFEGGEDLSRAVRFTLPARRLLRARGEKPEGQKLRVATIDGRPAVLFSEFDLSAAMAGVANYGAVGYRPRSARKIAGNILAYAMVD